MYLVVLTSPFAVPLINRYVFFPAFDEPSEGHASPQIKKSAEPSPSKLPTSTGALLAAYPVPSILLKLLRVVDESADSELPVDKNGVA
jgi:hypothetical protein